jgi:hypothetical protein
MPSRAGTKSAIKTPASAIWLTILRTVYQTIISPAAQIFVRARAARPLTLQSLNRDEQNHRINLSLPQSGKVRLMRPRAVLCVAGWDQGP